MGRKTLWTGIVLGATLGGLLSLINKDARNYVKHVATESVENLTFYSKNPETACKEIKMKVSNMNDMVAESTRSAINAIEQVENTIVTVRKSK